LDRAWEFRVVGGVTRAENFTQKAVFFLLSSSGDFLLVGDQRTYETSSMGRRVTDLTTLENRQLTLDPLSSFLRRSDDVQSTNTFTVQAGILGETLMKRNRSISSIHSLIY
jgi:hypothetical protein